MRVFGRLIYFVITLGAMLWPIAGAQACSGCGCRGGPGYRGPDGRCVGWSDIGRTCGDPPSTRCAPEGPNAGANDAAKYGVKAIEIRQTKNQRPEMKTSPRSIFLLAFVAPAFAADLPINPAVTQETIATTICTPGWTKTVRPSARYTARIKIKLIQELELPEELLVDFELDHRIPLAVDGATSDPRNLELQPWDEAREKDAIEACLARAVCAGRIALDEARHRIWTGWRHVGMDCDGGS